MQWSLAYTAFGEWKYKFGGLLLWKLTPQRDNPKFREMSLSQVITVASFNIDENKKHNLSVQ